MMKKRTLGAALAAGALILQATAAPAQATEQAALQMRCAIRMSPLNTDKDVSTLVTFDAPEDVYVGEPVTIRASIGDVVFKDGTMSLASNARVNSSVIRIQVSGDFDFVGNPPAGVSRRGNVIEIRDRVSGTLKGDTLTAKTQPLEMTVVPKKKGRFTVTAAQNLLQYFRTKAVWKCYHI